MIRTRRAQRSLSLSLVAAGVWLALSPAAHALAIIPDPIRVEKTGNE